MKNKTLAKAFENMVNRQLEESPELEKLIHDDVFHIMTHGEHLPDYEERLEKILKKSRK